MDAFTWTGFHNAVVDVLVLAAVVERLLERLHTRMQQHPGLAGEFCRLLPQAAGALGIDAEIPLTDALAAVVRDLATVDSHTARPRLAAWPEREAFSPESATDRFETMIADNEGLTLRPAQCQMVTEVARGFREGRFMCIEAPTGTGKTFAYLVPSVLWARSRREPVAISTYTRLLQDQMQSDVSTLKRLLDLDFTAQVLKGMNNYICLERAAAVYAQLDHDALGADERFAWLYLLSWLTETRDGLLSELSYWTQMRFPPKLSDTLSARQAARLAAHPARRRPGRRERRRLREYDP